jgi:hypothetical protein
MEYDYARMASGLGGIGNGPRIGQLVSVGLSLAWKAQRKRYRLRDSWAPRELVF